MPEAYSVLLRKRQFKKRKTWEQDGVLIIASTGALLFNPDGKQIGKSASTKKFDEDSTLFIGDWEMEISSTIKWEDYLSGKCFINQGSLQPTKIPKIAETVHAKFRKPLSTSNISPPSTPAPKVNKEIAGIKMPRPPSDCAKKVVRDVVIDPVLGKFLRPHQIEGVSFLYECAMGYRSFNGNGAILADDMGLGKSLQAVTLLWTLLKQSPFSGIAPTIKRALIVCPATLIGHWKAEVKKWLGDERVKVLCCDGPSDVSTFGLGKAYSILICGYERLRTVSKQLASAGIDIIIADEGHRLKNSDVQASKVLNSIQTKKRIILSGTPVQNDLSELFAMCDLVNPGVLGHRSSFTKIFEDPILRSREQHASKEAIALGVERSKEVDPSNLNYFHPVQLHRLTQLFLLRRTAESIKKYLPPRREFTIVVRLSQLQQKIYKEILEHHSMRSLRLESTSFNSKMAFSLISLLIKLTNSAELVKQDSGQLVDDLDLKSFIAKVEGNDDYQSSKLILLEQLLKSIKSTSDEKVVIVSNWTQTLDLVERVMETNSWNYMRLDGKTNVKARQDIVTRFNAKDSDDAFCMLLSAKAGGEGISLIGASRLVLFDINWNPAVCKQAQARIWREGQKKDVKIYRFLAHASIEEKIFQRQIFKNALGDEVFNDDGSHELFEFKDLRDLFTLNSEGDTSLNASIKTMPDWEFINQEDMESADPCLASTCGSDLGLVSLVLSKAG